jgi:hypothetical protein
MHVVSLAQPPMQLMKKLTSLLLDDQGFRRPVVHRAIQIKPRHRDLEQGRLVSSVRPHLGQIQTRHAACRDFGQQRRPSDEQRVRFRHLNRVLVRGDCQHIRFTEDKDGVGRQMFEERGRKPRVLALAQQTQFSGGRERHGGKGHPWRFVNGDRTAGSIPTHPRRTRVEPARDSSADKDPRMPPRNAISPF